MTENVASALCYILGLITGILFLVLAPYNQNRNIRFHAFQSIFGHIAWIASWIVLQVISLSFRTIPVLGVLISFALWLCLFFGGLCVWLYVMYKAYNNERVVLPVIGPMAEKQANS